MKEIRADRADVLTVIVSEGHEYLAQNSDLLAYVVYELSHGLRAVHVTVDDDYRAAHARLTLAGRLDHPLDRETEEKDLMKVRLWLGDQLSVSQTTTSATSGARPPL